VSWGDLPAGPDRAAYLSVFLDPDFIGTGNRIEESMALLLVSAILALAVRRARALVRARAAAERQRARVQAVFGQYVPAEVAETILADDGALTPRSRPASVLFCDIEGFTAMAERRAPADVIALLNGFFDRGTAIVSGRGGVVVSFVGDAIVAVFNAPLDTPDHAAQAIRAGAALIAETEARTFGGERLRLRVGVATGPVAAGSVGGATRQTWTVYGDTVNLAQRLEALNKRFGTRILVCEATMRAAGPAFGFGEVDTVAVRGRTAPTRVFAPAAPAAPAAGTP